jgi:hypothetical protein
VTAVEIIRYEDRHHTAVLELQQRLWSPSLALNRSYFQWKFVDNPNARHGDIFLAASGSRIVGMRGFMATLWTTPEGAPVPIPLAGDTVVAADFEGRGIVNRLSAAARSAFAERGIEFMFNTSASPAVFLHATRSGWSPIERYAEMRRRPTPRWLYKLMAELRRLPIFPDAEADPFGAQDGADWSLDRPTVVSLRSAPDPVAFAALWATVRPTKYAVVRDADFFRWRFTNPFFKYYFLTCRRDGRLVAWVALSLKERKRGPEVRIVDWCSTDPGDLRRLLDIFPRRFPHVPVNMLVNAFATVERAGLTEIGFRTIGRGGDQHDGKVRYRPGVLAIPTRGGSDGEATVRALAAGGSDLLDFRGIESDGA